MYWSLWNMMPKLCKCHHLNSISLEHMHGNDHTVLLFIFLRMYKVFSQMVVTNLHSQQQCLRFPISPHSDQHLLPVTVCISCSNWTEMISVCLPGYCQYWTYYHTPLGHVHSSSWSITCPCFSLGVGLSLNRLQIFCCLGQLFTLLFL